MHFYVKYLPKGECKMNKCIEKGINFQDTGFSYSMSLISGKYKLPILYSLACYGTFRYND